MLLVPPPSTHEMMWFKWFLYLSSEPWRKFSPIPCVRLQLFLGFFPFVFKVALTLLYLSLVHGSIQMRKSFLLWHLDSLFWAYVYVSLRKLHEFSQKCQKLGARSKWSLSFFFWTVVLVKNSHNWAVNFGIISACDVLLFGIWHGQANISTHISFSRWTVLQKTFTNPCFSFQHLLTNSYQCVSLNYFMDKSPAATGGKKSSMHISRHALCLSKYLWKNVVL